MRGWNVRRQPGWDCHGLPIEVKVEEKLGLRSKKDIEQRIGVAEFIRSCRQWALDHVALMTKQFKELGIWMDWDQPYITFKNEYVEVAWWTLKRAHEKGLLKKDLRVIHWCPRCETALAEHEVRGEYYEVKDPSLYVRFKLRDKPNEYLLVWTTTPWTLPADLAVCVHPAHEYARVLFGDSIYLVARELVEKVMAEIGARGYQILEVMRGKELEGLLYEHPLLEEVPKQKEFVRHHRVICGDHVTLEEGTGCVHTAPGHGEEDFEVGRRYDLPVFSPVGPSGKFTEEAGKYAGIFVKEADGMILDDLKRKGLLTKIGTIVHTYPHCWRCQTPLLFRATEQWFLIVKDLKSKILEKNSAQVKWVPDWVSVRYANGVESVGDWCISRQRYWGIPLPIWTCGACGKDIIVGSIDELQNLSTKPIEEIDLHRPEVDRITLRCDCGGDAKRTSDVLDVWFDSGIAPWASLRAPKEIPELCPGDFITEGEDQVTKWFYSQQVLSVVAFDEMPYKLVLMHGFALDERGRKMSKSLGNVVEPMEVIERYGADVLRFYMLSSNPPWEDLKFSWKGVESVNRLMNILWNVHVFATTYMALDGFDPGTTDVRRAQENLFPEDFWLLSRVNSLVREMTEALENFELHKATRSLANFVLEDLSRWYIKLIRGRVWIEREDPRKMAAYVTLYQAMHILVRVLSPFAPHLTERIYRDLVKSVSPTAPESVHMLPWPTPDERFIDKNLELGMDLVRAFVENAARLRQESKLKLRWPVQKVVVQPNDLKSEKALKKLSDLFQSQLNCKELIILSPQDEFSHAIEEAYPSVETEVGRIAMDVRTTPELKAEGIARELVRRLQTMRKEMNLGMEERVDVVIVVEEESDLALLSSQQDYISREVRVRNLRLTGAPEIPEEGYLKDWTIDGKRFRLFIKRLPC
jgi:isoleucyl-tRNA synthetase